LTIRPDTFSIISLGCPKNLVDSEQHVFARQKNGLTFHTDIEHCELVVLNTCGFLQSARHEAREYIDALVELKNKRRIGRIAVRGCMPAFEGIDLLAAEFPDVDEWSGVPPASEQSAPRHLLTATHVAYLRIADGCSRRCAYCAIPTIRGNFRSVPEETIIQEAERLAEAGVKELIVIAQETTFWGSDLDGKPKLATLLQRLEQIEGFRWIRLMYTYPQYFEDELIDLFAAGGKLLPYIDIPLQHANDEILQKMNRRVTTLETERLLEKLRTRIDHLVLRTSFIVGFPGETDAMFRELLHFAERWKFERAGVFRFSAEPGTPAEQFTPKVPAKTIDRRWEQLHKTCEKHSIAWANRQKGKILNVQIDGNYVDANDMDKGGRKEPQLFIGRTVADAPDIDPVVYVTGEHLPPGSLIECEIVEINGNDLVGIAVS
jgi:ribosomal protein S12 methylthiotransferase